MTPLTIRLTPSDEGGYTVAVDELPGCISEGDTAREALHNIAEAIKLWKEQAGDT